MIILVINPNSNQAVTYGLASALAPLAAAEGPEIECITLPEGPFGIETQADVDFVVAPLQRLISSRQDADAFIIACYSDPGLALCRKITPKPVFGIQQCGILTALSLGNQFGVIALSEASIHRHLKNITQMGVIDRLAKERAIDVSVNESAQGSETFARLCETGAALRDSDGAETIILGCAGMAKHRARLEDHLKIPVIDPTQPPLRWP